MMTIIFIIFVGQHEVLCNSDLVLWSGWVPQMSHLWCVSAWENQHKLSCHIHLQWRHVSVICGDVCQMSEGIICDVCQSERTRTSYHIIYICNRDMCQILAGMCVRCQDALSLMCGVSEPAQTIMSYTSVIRDMWRCVSDMCQLCGNVCQISGCIVCDVWEPAQPIMSYKSRIRYLFLGMIRYESHLRRYPC